MRQSESVSLENLHDAWKSKQEREQLEDEISGRNLTVNPDEKYRKARLISPVKKYRRVTPVQDFLNYCKWRVGERSEVSKPLAVFGSVLTAVKKGDLSTVSAGYQQAYTDYKDLIDRAANVDMRSKRKQDSSYLIKANKVKIDEHKAKLRQALTEIINLKQGISRHIGTKAAEIARCIAKPDTKYAAGYIKEVLQEPFFKTSMANYRHYKGRLIHKDIKPADIQQFRKISSPMAEPTLEDAYLTLSNIVKSVNYSDFPLYATVTVEEPEKPKKPKKTKAELDDLSNKVTEAVEEGKMSIVEPEQPTSDSLEGLISRLKALGVKEFSIKF